jgi:hypothetical protein
MDVFTHPGETTVMPDEETPSELTQACLIQEDRVQERIDEEGNTWRKVYFGGGAHFENWLEQCKELGEVWVEEVDPAGYSCFEEGGETLYRIWMKMDPHAAEAEDAAR